MKPITRKEKLIAGEKLTPITREEMFLKKYGGGGASSWNDLTDKPFGEVTETIEPITWDGNTEGLVEFVLEPFGKFYKVSDKAFSNEQIKTMSASVYSEWVDPGDSGSGVFPIDLSEEWDYLIPIGLATEDYVAHPDGILVVRKNDAVLPDGAALPDIGTYFRRKEQNDEGSYYLEYMTSFPSEAITETTIKKIDEKYLPESNVFTVVVTNHGDEELTIDKSFEDAMLAAKSGKYIDAKYVFANSSGSFEYGQFYAVSFTPDNYDVPCFEVSDSSNNNFYWTSDGISTEAPSGGR